MTQPAPVSLTELQLDALTELVNLGISNAALGLRDMVREEVVLSVPRVSLVSREQAVLELGDHATLQLVAVHQSFEGAISGSAMLLFPESKSMELVRALVGGDLSVEDIMEVEQEALAETGNVLLNACVGTLANSLERTLRISLPEVLHSQGDPHVILSIAGSSDFVLFIHINFAVQRRSISGHIVILLDLPSLMSLQELLDGFIAKTAGLDVRSAGS